ncbi:MAG: hypothetical protein NTZ27_11025 [Ignavibacteriales bacterium]|nr:hypothetical protein [Ignavibacteriales bacterium]
MKRISFLLFPLLLLSFFVFSCDTAPTNVNQDVTQPVNQKISLAKKGDCTTIQSGTLLASDGSVIKTGYDKWGYNYQAMMFNGKYCDSYRNADWCQEWKDVNLQMNWNEAWLSNKDCDGDGLLDRHFGFASYRGSGAWITNHQSGTYIWDGKTYKWSDFVKIIAVPLNANLVGGVWYNADGTEIGPSIWGDFAIIQEVYNDSGTGDHGLLYKSPDHAGFGGW